MNLVLNTENVKSRLSLTSRELLADVGNPVSLGANTSREDSHQLGSSGNFTPHAADEVGRRGDRRLEPRRAGRASRRPRAGSQAGQAHHPILRARRLCARLSRARARLLQGAGPRRDVPARAGQRTCAAGAHRRQRRPHPRRPGADAPAPGPDAGAAHARGRIDLGQAGAVAVLPEGQGHRQAEGPGRPQHRQLARLNGAVHLQPVRQGERHRHQQGAVEERSRHRKGGDDAAEPGRTRLRSICPPSPASNPSCRRARRSATSRLATRSASTATG